MSDLIKAGEIHPIKDDKHGVVIADLDMLQKAFHLLYNAPSFAFRGMETEVPVELQTCINPNALVQEFKQHAIVYLKFHAIMEDGRKTWIYSGNVKL